MGSTYDPSDASLSSSEPDSDDDDDPAEIFESKLDEASLCDGSDAEDRWSKSSSSEDESVEGARNVEREWRFLETALSFFPTMHSENTYGLRTGDGDSDLGTLNRMFRPRGKMDGINWMEFETVVKDKFMPVAVRID